MLKKKFLPLLLLMCLLTFVATTLIVAADSFSFKWAYASNGVVKMNSNDDNLETKYKGTNYLAGIGKWNSSNAPVIITDHSFNGSNLDFYSSSQTTWSNNGWGTGEAWAKPFSSGTACSSNPFQDPGVKCDTVNYGAIYTNTGNVSSDTNRRKAVIAHEAGHIMGLAHQSRTWNNSIMCAALKCGYSVSSLDVEDVNAKY